MSFHRTPVDLPRGARATGTHHFGSQPAHLPSARGRSPVAVPADTTASATRVAPSGGRFGHPSMTHDGSAALPPSSGLPGILGFFATAASDDPALHTPHRHGTPAPHLSGSGRGGRGGRRPTGRQRTDEDAHDPARHPHPHLPSGSAFHAQHTTGSTPHPTGGHPAPASARTVSWGPRSVHEYDPSLRPTATPSPTPILPMSGPGRDSDVEETTLVDDPARHPKPFMRPAASAWASVPPAGATLPATEDTYADLSYDPRYQRSVALPQTPLKSTDIGAPPKLLSIETTDIRKFLQDHTQYCAALRLARRVPQPFYTFIDSGVLDILPDLVLYYTSTALSPIEHLEGPDHLRAWETNVRAAFDMYVTDPALSDDISLADLHKALQRTVLWNPAATVFLPAYFTFKQRWLTYLRENGDAVRARFYYDSRSERKTVQALIACLHPPPWRAHLSSRYTDRPCGIDQVFQDLAKEADAWTGYVGFLKSTTATTTTTSGDDSDTADLASRPASTTTPTPPDRDSTPVPSAPHSSCHRCGGPHRHQDCWRHLSRPCRHCRGDHLDSICPTASGKASTASAPTTGDPPASPTPTSPTTASIQCLGSLRPHGTLHIRNVHVPFTLDTGSSLSVVGPVLAAHLSHSLSAAVAPLATPIHANTCKADSTVTLTHTVHLPTADVLASDGTTSTLSNIHLYVCDQFSGHTVIGGRDILAQLGPVMTCALLYCAAPPAAAIAPPGGDPDCPTVTSATTAPRTTTASPVQH